MNRIGRTTRGPRRLPQRRRRGAVMTVEMMFILPILVVVLLAMAEFAFMLLGMQAVAAAANVGAREAALPSATIATVETAVDDALAGWSFQGYQEVAAFVEGTKDDGANMEVENAMTGDEMQVTVVLPTEDAVPDMLKFIGLSIVGQEIRATFVTRRE